MTEMTEDEIAELLSQLLWECMDDVPIPSDLVKAKVWKEYREKVLDCVRNRRSK